MPDFLNAVVSDVSGHWKRGATGQGGLLSGLDPTAFTTSDPLRLWIIQMGIVITLGQLLALGLGKIKQPKVIAEVLAGILLGPTAMGRIPGFTEHIFPAQSLPYFSLVANIGLCLFLFIIGLEIDGSILKRSARSSVVIALSAITLSFGLGAAISVPLYHNFIGPSIKFTYFMLFTGVSFSITAFPVLCRILTALKLLDTTVGAIVLSAGVCNDVVGWSLLALAVALVNATSGLAALWILLTSVAFIAFLMWPVRIALLWFATFTGSTENGPTMTFMTVTILILWTSAFFTDIVGVNAIFGAFLAGIIVPREGGLAISLTEKLEDMVTIVFLPLYFTYSGLNTNLGLLNNGITWGFTIAIICLDFTGKFSACTITSRIFGMSWRESSTIGSLMTCKGLVELIVLNIGLAAGILTPTVFSMFVFEALVLTFMTTPLVSWLYPPERRVRAPAGAGISRASTGDSDEDKGDRKSPMTEDQPWRSRFAVVLDKFDHMSGMLVATQLLCPPSLGQPSVRSTKSISASDKIKMPAFSVDALRLIELSDRTSAVMKSSAVDTLIRTDPVLGVFRTFGELNDLSVSLSLSIVPYEDMPDTVADHAKRYGSHLVLLPWLPSSNFGDTNEVPSSPHSMKVEPNPFDALFGGSKSNGKSTAVIHSQFVRRVFAESKTDVALFIDRADAGTGSVRHIFFPFFGGPDDRLALEFVVQLCANPRTSATVVRMSKSSAESAGVQRPSLVHLEKKASLDPDHGMHVSSNIIFPDPAAGQSNTVTRFKSETADSILWARYAQSHLSSDTPPSLCAALSRINFSEHSSPIPLHSAIQMASAHTPVLVVVGRSQRLAGEDHTLELQKILEERGIVGQDVVRQTIGDSATAFVASGCATAVVVLQAANVNAD
ncbi:Sodium/hydrogen exchanger family-domain-containing protein [Suillus paluster]|uniref:Sodium/hydrogen exchanger family-domain-containing protein n=1 Tax=Suillus paluster TaxID=48578 RepID=UPI001B8810D0|nr:Sodium/hydrogen exchanger family-domain-containing protein [Suillus paluster]KAG1735307.1 Sodium/hydrogen exchanger family-domain-containing protein [Suillus paluster]